MIKLQDDIKRKDSEVFNLPVKISKDKKTKEAKLNFDFSAKGGPKDTMAVLGTSGTTTTLAFSNGNVWKKETGVISAHRDGFDASKTRVIRKVKGSKLTLDLIQSPTNHCEC